MWSPSRAAPSLWPGSGARVYVERAPGVYSLRSVTPGRAGDTEWEILGGLTPGERVVQSGAMLLDGQAQLDQLARPPDEEAAP